MERIDRNRTANGIFAFTIFVGYINMVVGCTQAGPSLEPENPIRIEASETIVGEQHEFTGFAALEISGFNASIVQGSTFFVETETDQNLAPYTEVSYSNRTLFVGLDPGGRYDLATELTRDVNITLPELTSLLVDGVGSASISNFDGGDLIDVSVGGVSSVTGHISAGTIRLVVEGVSKATLSGTCDLLELDWGGSYADLSELAATDATVAADGIGSIEISASGNLSVSATSLVDIIYHGDPVLSEAYLSGGATLNPAEG